MGLARRLLPRSWRPRAASARAGEAPVADPIDYERIEQIVRTVAEELWQRRSQMYTVLQDVALEDSARFVIDHIPLHLGKGHFDMRRDAILGAHENGLFLEFGVWNGAWLRQMAQVRDVSFFGFDSFEGLPEPWSLSEAGEFDLGGIEPAMPPNVTLVKGLFADSLPPFLEQHPGNVSFVHIDCDLYSSTKTVLDLLGERFVPGTQIVLDDFMYSPGWQRAEHRAFFEFIESRKWRFEYTGYSTEYPACSASVRLLSKT